MFLYTVRKFKLLTMVIWFVEDTKEAFVSRRLSHAEQSEGSFKEGYLFGLQSHSLIVPLFEDPLLFLIAFGCYSNFNKQIQYNTNVLSINLWLGEIIVVLRLLHHIFSYVQI